MNDCTFCRIVAGELPVRIVHEDEAAIAFLDTSPAARGHTLVVPRAHAVQIWDADESSFADVARAVHRVALRLRERLQPDGLTLRQNNGEASGQKVDHVHVHLVPRWHGDGTVGWPWPPPVDLDLDAVHAQLRD
ncbi:MAG: hypothetical protein JWN17_1533 [Frankiales bacterium]|nr:hypothetical protein [Frankiales bacterium]